MPSDSNEYNSRTYPAGTSGIVIVTFPAEDATSFARAKLSLAPISSRLKAVGSLGSSTEKNMVTGWPVVRGPAGVSRMRLVGSVARLRKTVAEIDLG